MNERHEQFTRDDLVALTSFESLCSACKRVVHATLPSGPGALIGSQGLLINSQTDEFLRWRLLLTSESANRRHKFRRHARCAGFGSPKKCRILLGRIDIIFALRHT